MELIDESMTESGLNELIKMADVDKDGRINYEGTIILGQISVTCSRLLWNQYKLLIKICFLFQSSPKCFCKFVRVVFLLHKIIQMTILFEKKINFSRL